MWFNKQKKFIYFYFAKNSCTNNNNGKKVFSTTFDVHDDDKLRWSSNGDSLILSPEVLTYWNEE